MLNLAIVLTENAQRFPERTAVIADDRKLSYGELDAITSRLADSLGAAWACTRARSC